MRFPLPALLVLCVSAHDVRSQEPLPQSSASLAVENIPSPRPLGWTVDLTGRVPADALTKLNALGDRVHRENGAELAVVVVPSTHGQNSREFATRLFNHWSIGDAQQDNGVLVFAALDDRKAEIVLGEGVDEAVHIRTAETIMQQEMVPRFRDNDVPGALFAGAQACAVQILHVPGLMAEAPPTLPATPVRAVPAPRAAPVKGGVWSWIGWSALGAIGLAGAGLSARAYYRLRRRTCRACRTPMVRLDEANDDKHLECGERTEERLGSVDYDVWACPTCSDVQKVRFGALFSRYSKCPQCRYRTRSKVTQTLRQATILQGGLVQVEESCAHCTYRHSYTYATPQVSDTTASHGSASFGSFGGSSGSSSGFGGGSSSGGGATGSW